MPFSAPTAWPQRCRAQAKERKLDVIDATCPLVTKVHLEAVRFARDGYSIVLIGHKDHDEVIGTLGEVPDRSYLVETVEDVDRLELPDPHARPLSDPDHSQPRRDPRHCRPPEGAFPLDSGPAGAGYLLRHRKSADGGESGFANACDLLLVVGSQNSSNSKRLVEVGDNFGVRSYLVNDRGDIDRSWLEGVKNVAVTAGASAPEHLVQELIAFLQSRRFSPVGGNRTGGRGCAFLAAFGA